MAGKRLATLQVLEQPPCVKEGSAIMSPETIRTQHTHPYGFLWPNLAPTELAHKPYSVPVVPFERMLKEYAPEIAAEWDLDYQASREPSETRDFDFVNSDKNQESMLDGFFGAVRPKESLVFFYAKRTPMTDDPKRVLIGVGRVLEVAPRQDYAGSDRGVRQVLWDRTVQHSVRPDFLDGFLMPYHEILRECQAKGIDPKPYAAPVPVTGGSEFLFRAGLVPSDSALAALTNMRNALQAAIKDDVLAGSWNHVLGWLDQRIAECWFDRGPCPGLRGSLAAAGIAASAAAALELHHLAAGKNPWPMVEAAVNGKPATPTLGRHFRGLAAMRLKSIMAEKGRYQLLQLLSRFSLSKEQAIAWLARTDAATAITNPYQLFLKTRKTKDPIPFEAIDRTLFGQRSQDHSIGLSDDWFDAPPDHPPRVAALVVAALEQAKTEGHTWLPEASILERIKEFAIDRLPEVRAGDLGLLIQQLPEVKPIPNGWQLDYLQAAESAIRADAIRRVQGKQPIARIDADAALDRAIGKPLASDRDRDARREKAQAIDILANRAIATLDGPAGCGKTTLIKALSIGLIPTSGRILCIAPTGKARVQMERAFEGFTGPRPDFKTVHSFLLALKRYRFEDGTVDFSPTGQVAREYATVVVDEASMLDTEMLAAVMAACVPIPRLILVGDPRQLPPIGPGRPFVDLLDYLRPSGAAAQLTTIMRSNAADEAPFRFARLFDPTEKSHDYETWTWPDLGAKGNLQFLYWKNEGELFQHIHEWIKARLPSGEPGQAFDVLLGASLFQGNNSCYFNLGKADRAEAWQVLAPRRSGLSGTDEINLQVKNAYRNHWLDLAASGRIVGDRTYREISKPTGDMQVTYGDKVICNQNHENGRYWPADAPALGYVANGEVGIAIGPRKTKNISSDLWKRLRTLLQVEFTSQKGARYDFKVKDDAMLELAYALTIHRTQGSQFGETLVVVPRTAFLGPEMMYTALTRSTGPATLLIEEGPKTILEYTNPRKSHVGVRLTNLFRQSRAEHADAAWFDANRIHRATDGTYVRSKSELVIVNLLLQNGLPYQYEPTLQLGTEMFRPDFALTRNGRTYYWEHLGMLTKAAYAKDWADKQAAYTKAGLREDSPGDCLIVTRDGIDGSLDAQEIQSVIDRILLGN